MMREAVADYRVSGQLIALPLLLGTLGEVLTATGDREAAMAVINEALAVVESSGDERFEGELHRLKGEVYMHHKDWDSAAACLRRAGQIAHTQGARWWELRTSTSLGRLVLQSDRGAADRRAAREALAASVAWFTEGFDTADFQQAKQVLTELS